MCHQIVIVFKSYDTRVSFLTNQNFIIVNFFGKTLIHLWSLLCIEWNFLFSNVHKHLILYHLLKYIRIYLLSSKQDKEIYLFYNFQVDNLTSNCFHRDLMTHLFVITTTIDCSQSSIFPQNHRHRALCVTGCHLEWVSKLLRGRVYRNDLTQM